ncbi:MAG: DUF192 domain-containing protein [Candidatus Omnitrophica bacterium]|nr:DUF192 domain-containing protein [Candidatus Omnitrophota bacterium]
MIAITNTTKNTLIARNGRLADTFFSRMIGLLNRPCLPKDEALIITCCQSIHMFFMRFAIDAIFVDKKDCVVGIVKSIKPFRLSPIFFKASYVIEVPEGAIVQSETSIGDKIQVQNN